MPSEQPEESTDIAEQQFAEARRTLAEQVRTTATTLVDMRVKASDLQCGQAADLIRIAWSSLSDAYKLIKAK